MNSNLKAVNLKNIMSIQKEFLDAVVVDESDHGLLEKKQKARAALEQFDKLLSTESVGPGDDEVPEPDECECQDQTGTRCKNK